MSFMRSLGRLTLILCFWLSGPLILARPLPSIPAEETSLPEGTLIRLRGDTDIYVIQDGRKCYILKQSTRKGMTQLKWSKSTRLPLTTS